MGTAIKGLASFFKTDSLIGRQREEVVAAQTALIHKNNANKKRKRVDVKFEHEGAGGSADTSLQNVAEMYKGEGIENKAPKSIYDESTSGITFSQTISTSSDQEWEFRKPLPPPAKRDPKGLPKKKLKIVKGLPNTGAKVLQSVSNSKPGSSGKYSNIGEQIMKRLGILKSMKEVCWKDFTKFVLKKFFWQNWYVDILNKLVIHWI